MISAAVVLYDTQDSLIKTIINSFSPNKGRILFFIDNSKSESMYFKKNFNKYIYYFFVGKNIGYGAAHNIGIAEALKMKSTYHIVLNPDLNFKSSVIDELCKYANEHKDVVYILPKVISQSGEVQYLCKLLPKPRNLIFRRLFKGSKITQKWDDQYTLKYFNYDKILNPPCLSGCFMFLRTETLLVNQILFDEHFFMYCEDFDLIRRLHRVGKTIYYPYVFIIHEHERASYTNKKMLLLHIKSAIRYFCKYGWFKDDERKKMNSEVIKEIRDMKESKN